MKVFTLLALLAVILVAVLIAGLRHTAPEPSKPPAPQARLVPAAANATKSPPASAALLVKSPGFQPRPFPVAYESRANQWTQADGKDTNVIRQLAHNPLEYARMVEENSRILRRQLVYRKEPVPVLLQRAISGGQPLRSLILPGLDGQEVEVEVTDTQVNGLAQSGSVTGRVKGRFNSMVSVGFANGYESFNIISPDDGLCLTADAREPGEVMVKGIDPNQYAPPTGDAPDFITTK